jgi:hypothetical protein
LIHFKDRGQQKLRVIPRKKLDTELQVLKMNLADQIKPGEPAEKAIPRLWVEYGGSIYNLGLRLCRDPEIARDLVQETFLRAVAAA